MFKLVSKYKPSGDQPEAIKALVDGINEGKKHQVLLGATGTGKTFTIANVIEQTGKPTLVLAHNKNLAVHYATAEKISEQTKMSFKDVAQYLEDFSTAEKNFLYLHVDSIEAKEDIDKFAKQYQNTIKVLNSKQNALTVKAIVEDSSKTELTSDETNMLSSNEEFLTYLKGQGKDFNQFKNQEYYLIRDELIAFYKTQNDAILADVDAALTEAYSLYEDVQDLPKTMAEGMAEKLDINEAFITDSFLAGIENFDKTTELLVNGKLNTELPEAFAVFKETLGLTDDEAAAYIETAIQNYNQLSEQVNERNAKEQTYYDLLKLQEEGVGELSLEYLEAAEAWDELYDRYFKWNKQLDAISRQLDDLRKKQEYLHGDALIKSIEHENKLLKDQQNLYKEIQNEQVIEAQETGNKLLSTNAAQFLEFNEDGTIKDYAASTKAIKEYYDKNPALKEEHETVQELLEEYVELVYEAIPETAQAIRDMEYELISNNLKAWEVKIEADLETKEAEREWADFTKEIHEDFKSTVTDFESEMTNAISHMNSYFAFDKNGEMTGTLATNMAAAQEVMKEIYNMENIEGYKSDMFVSSSEAGEKLKELQSQIMSDAKTAKKAWQDAWDTYLDAIDEAADKVDELNEEYNRINEGLEYQRELTELLYGSDSYELFGEIFNAQVNNSLAQIEYTREQVDLWQSYYDQAEEGSEEQLKYAELLQQAQDNLNDSVLEHIQLIKDDYTNAIDKALSDIDKALSNGLGIDKMREEWERALEEDEKYYTGVERIYELSSLRNKYQTAINNTADIKGQAAIRQLMEDQLSILENKEKLTEYDIEMAQKRLAITEAEIALEDAQNAKNAMKLVRGADGNWNYQYVADTSDIQDKQQDVMDAYKDLWDYSKEAQQESMDAILDAKEQYLEELKDILSDQRITQWIWALTSMWQTFRQNQPEWQWQ